ncbi:MAG: glycosyltransferase family 2 protein [Pyrinomonadaceae bacterium]|nr:glycosyltransferase family 2 protein [Pyrinomonadaceae bacterium]
MRNKPLNQQTEVFAHQQLIETPQPKQCEISVTIPVRDEAENLPKTLRAAAKQFDFNGEPFDPKKFEIIVLANNCSDDSAQIVRDFAKQNVDSPPIHVVEIDFPKEKANVGNARKTVMELAFRRFAQFGKRGVIASTDGDTRVSTNWLAANLREIGNGANAVGGRIFVDKAELAELDETARCFHIEDTKYRLLSAELEGFLNPNSCDKNPRHHQHFGASFAVTTDFYEKSGGVPCVSSLEDVAFYKCLQKIDAKFRHSPLVSVTTSARQIGKTDCGLSTQLEEWKRMGETKQNYVVDSAEWLFARFHGDKILRDFWLDRHNISVVQTIEKKRFADHFCMEFDWLENEIQSRRFFGELQQNFDRKRHENGWHLLWNHVEISKAIADLTQIIAKFRDGNKTKIVQRHRGDNFPRVARPNATNSLPSTL